MFRFTHDLSTGTQTYSFVGLRYADSFGFALRIIVAIVAVTLLWLVGITDAAPSANSDPNQPQVSEAARQSAVQSIPFEKLDESARAKVQSALSNTTMYRRMPVRLIECDPDVYLFSVRHPDVVVNTWRALKLTQLELTQIAPRKFQIKEDTGMSAVLEYLYQGRDMHVIFADGEYDGQMLPRPVKGRALFVLKTGYTLQTDGRYFISTRLDTFLSVEPGAAELVTKALQPFVGRVADNNFTQTVNYVGSLSRTIELNGRSVEKLALQLPNVSAKTRTDFADVIDAAMERPTAIALRRRTNAAEISRRLPAGKSDESVMLK